MPNNNNPKQSVNLGGVALNELDGANPLSINQLKVEVLKIASKHTQFEGDSIDEVAKGYTKLIALLNLV